MSKLPVSPARIDVVHRIYAAQAEYLKLTGWTPYIMGPGKIRWHANPANRMAGVDHATGYKQGEAFSLQKQYDQSLWEEP